VINDWRRWHKAHSGPGIAACYIPRADISEWRVNLLAGPYSKRRKLALEGKLYLTPLVVVMAATFALSYLSSMQFDMVSGFAQVGEIAAYGINHVPAIAKSLAFSPYPEKCGFVMTVQWFLFWVYAVVLFVGYFPMAPTIRVAIRRRMATKPTSHMFLRGVGFLAFAVAYILGDFSVIHFPTFFNGGMIAAEIIHSIWSIAAMIEDPVWMPFIAWLAPLATAIIYWGTLYALVNFKLLVEQDD
jgi:hypothetical protein